MEEKEFEGLIQLSKIAGEKALKTMTPEQLGKYVEANLKEIGKLRQKLKDMEKTDAATEKVVKSGSVPNSGETREITNEDYVKRVLAALSGLLDTMFWHEYLDEKYIANEDHRKARDDLSGHIEDARQIVNRLFLSGDAREIIAKYVDENVEVEKGTL